MRFLIARRGDIDAIARHPIKVSPLHAALFGRRVEAARVLIDAGANVTLKRGGKGWPRSGWTALHYCASLGFVDLIKVLLERGAEIDALDDEGKTALKVAVESSNQDAAEVLLNSRANQ